MAQLHFYVPDELDERLRRRAAASGTTVSQYIATIVREAIAGDEWPDGWFEQLGGSLPGLEIPEDAPPEEPD